MILNAGCDNIVGYFMTLKGIFKASEREVC